MNSWGTPVNLSNSETLSGGPSMAVGSHPAWCMWCGARRLMMGVRLSATRQPKPGQLVAANEITGSQLRRWLITRRWLQTQLAICTWCGAAMQRCITAGLTPPLLGKRRGGVHRRRWSMSRTTSGVRTCRSISENVLHLVYPILLGSNSGIYYTKSSDGGFNWSDPTRIYKISVWIAPDTCLPGGGPSEVWAAARCLGGV